MPTGTSSYRVAADMVPGDFIEWTYKIDDSVVAENELLWSTYSNEYFPIGGLNLLIACWEKNIRWFCDKGLFHARVWMVLT